MEQREDGGEVVMGDQVLEAVEEDDSVLPDVDEMLDRDRHVLRGGRSDRVLLGGRAAQPKDRRALEPVVLHDGLRGASGDAKALSAVRHEVLEDLKRLAPVPLEDRVDVAALEVVRGLRLEV